MFLVGLFFVAYMVAYIWGIATLSKGQHKKFWLITGITIISHIGIVYAESKLSHSSVDMAQVIFHQLILAVYVVLMGLSATLVGISRRSVSILAWSVPIVILAILAIASLFAD